MNLYILLICSLWRIIVLKFIRHKRIKGSYIQRISHKACLKIFGEGVLLLGRNLQIEADCDFQVHKNGQLSIGDKTYFNRFCMISAQHSIKIGSNCMFGPGVRIFDNNHRYSRYQGVSSELNVGKIEIGNNCWIASNVIILKNTIIGDNCVIGAGCVVSGIIKSGSLVKQKNNLIIEDIKS